MDRSEQPGSKWFAVEFDECGRVLIAIGPEGWLLTNSYTPDGELLSQRFSGNDPETGNEIWQEFDGSGELVRACDAVLVDASFIPSVGDVYQYVGHWGYRQEAHRRSDVWLRVDSSCPRGVNLDPEAARDWAERQQRTPSRDAQ